VSSEVFHALVFWVPAFLFSTTVHECAHAWAALRLGDPTAYHGGQVSLSPWPHLRRSPLGMLIVPLATSFLQGWAMGWASAPLDRAWAERHPRRAALTALAGPLGNLLLALSAFALLQAGLWAGVFEPASTLSIQHWVQNALPPDPLLAGDFVARGLSVLLSLNLLLFVFNLLPLPPLDGASVVTLVLPGAAGRSLRAASAAPALSLVGLLAAWQVFPLLAAPLLAVVAQFVMRAAR
jgi:Zn-dependent protease